MRHTYGLISDTHGVVHRDVHRLFEGVEAIFHAGDVGELNVLAELGTIANVEAVAGNMDRSLPQLPRSLVLELPFGRIAIAHGHLYPEDRESRAKALLKDFHDEKPRIIMHGHSHLPLLDSRGGIYIVNPGAAGSPRFGVPSSVCLLEWDSDHDLLRFDFQPLVWR